MPHQISRTHFEFPNPYHSTRHLITTRGYAVPTLQDKSNCILHRSSQIFFVMLRNLRHSIRQFSTKATVSVTKGRVHRLEAGKALVTVESTGEKVWSHIHPKGSHASISVDSTVFVSRPFASDPSRDDFELIAFGTKGADQKLVFTKFSCIHPERPLSNLEKLCSNCPRRSTTL